MFENFEKMAEYRATIKLDTSIGLKKLLKLYKNVKNKKDFTDDEYIFLINSIRDIICKYNKYLKKYEKILVDSALIDESFYKLADKLGIYFTKIKFKKSVKFAADWYSWFVYEDNYGKSGFDIEIDGIKYYILNIKDFINFMKKG